MLFSAGRTIRLMLSVLMLLGGLPSRQHSHGEADAPHEHCADLDRCQHDHAQLAASSTHLHFAILGWNFTLPVAPDSDNPDTQGPPTFLGAAAATLEFAQPHAPAFPSALPSAPTHGTIHPALSVAHFRCITAVAAPLSDNARHERSGVQLI